MSCLVFKFTAGWAILSLFAIWPLTSGTNCDYGEFLESRGRLLERAEILGKARGRGFENMLNCFRFRILSISGQCKRHTASITGVFQVFYAGKPSSVILMILKPCDGISK